MHNHKIGALVRGISAGLVGLLAGTINVLTAVAQDKATTVADESSAGLSLTVGDLYAGQTKMESSGETRGRVSVNRFAFGVGETITQEFKVGFSYQVSEIGHEQSNLTGLPGQLRTIAAAATYTPEIEPGWTGILLVNPGWYTAAGGSAFGARGFGVTTGVGVRREISPTLKATVGVAYNTLASRHYRIVPFSGLEWKVNGDWTLVAGVPQTGISYAATKELRLAWLVLANGGSYYVEKDPRGDTAGKLSLARSKLEHFEILTGPSATYAWTKTSFVSISAGSVLYRRFEYRDLNYKSTSRDAAPYVTGTVGFGF